MTQAIIFLLVTLTMLVLIYLGFRIYNRFSLFTDRNLVEAAIGIAGIRRAALENIEPIDSKRPMRADDPRHWISRENLVLAYTIRQDGPRFVHQCSISLAGGKTPHKVGRLFTALFAYLLGVPAEGLEAHISRKGRYYLGFILSETQQERYESRKVPLPNFGNTRTLRRELDTMFRRMRFRDVSQRGKLR